VIGRKKDWKGYVTFIVQVHKGKTRFSFGLLSRRLDLYIGWYMRTGSNGEKKYRSDWIIAVSRRDNMVLFLV
jgi:hypothetical protein